MRPTVSQPISHWSRIARVIRNARTDEQRWTRNLCIVTCFALSFCAIGIACEPRDAAIVRGMPEKPADFDATSAAFEWPDEPSHVVALTIANHGTIRLGLYAQIAPRTVAHVVECIDRGVYDDTLFHRVIKDFMIQGGDPATRKRGPDSEQPDWGNLSVEDEIQPIRHNRGTVSMANRGRPGSANSQFFIVQRDSRHLDGKYTAFGRVISGMDVVDTISAVETDLHGRWGDKDKPLRNIIVERALVEHRSLVAGDDAADSLHPDRSGSHATAPPHR